MLISFWECQKKWQYMNRNEDSLQNQLYVLYVCKCNFDAMATLSENLWYYLNEYKSKKSLSNDGLRLTTDKCAT